MGRLSKTAYRDALCILKCSVNIAAMTLPALNIVAQVRQGPSPAALLDALALHNCLTAGEKVKMHSASGSHLGDLQAGCLKN